MRTVVETDMEALLDTFQEELDIFVIRMSTKLCLSWSDIRRGVNLTQGVWDSCNNRGLERPQCPHVWHVHILARRIDQLIPSDHAAICDNNTREHIKMCSNTELKALSKTVNLINTNIFNQLQACQINYTL